MSFLSLAEQNFEAVGMPQSDLSALDSVFWVDQTLPEKADAVIIFGNSRMETIPDMKRAIARAVGVSAPLVIATGGPLKDRDISEADLIQSWLPALPSSTRLLLERRARNTIENCKYSVADAPELLEAKHIHIVAAEAHCPRLEMTLRANLRKAGLKGDVAITFSPYHHPGVTRANELGGIVDYGLSGELDWGDKADMVLACRPDIAIEGPSPSRRFG